MKKFCILVAIGVLGTWATTENAQAQIKIRSGTGIGTAIKGAFSKGQLTPVPESKQVTFANRGTQSVSFAVADSRGKISGWYNVAGGQEIQLQFPLGEIYLHVQANGQPRTMQNPMLVLPLHPRNGFTLQHEGDNIFKVSDGGVDRGKLHANSLAQLGFAWHTFYRFDSQFIRLD
ncbi:MAG: hypothetical protein KF851_10345 [Pirellulaceae bacterium]|nr:hypothetical protein [Pirellulaceae bacterium]